MSPGDATAERPTSWSEHDGDGQDDGRGGDGVATEVVGVGGVGTDAGLAGVTTGGDADELEDWLDDMLADA